MERIKPRISLAGYQKALREYGNEPNRIVEELVANSYDADAYDVAIVYTTNRITIVDNGSGIAESQFPKVLDLGSGTKLGTHDSRLKRSYLGSFGFGLKSTVNIAKTIKIGTINKTVYMSAEIDVPTLNEKGFNDSNWDGFEVEVNKSPKSKATGTAISLELQNDLTPDQIEDIRRSLYNLPKSSNFRVYFASSKQAGKTLNSTSADAILSLQSEIKKRLKKERIAGTLEIGTPKITKCVLSGSDTIDVSVWCKGLDSNMKVENLGQLAGVYVKVDGRVLKRNFQGEKVLDGISKYPKFKHGMRIEIPIDWLKEQINLGRDGLQFGNESSRRKFENELKTAVSTAVRPFAKMLETRKSRAIAKELDLRMKKAKERIKQKQLIRGLAKSGYAYVPQDDYEMALLIANPAVLKMISPNWILMDFNGQLDFDCLVYDRSTSDFIKVELEPELERFISQSILQNTDFIVTWKKGDWKVGKTKKGRGGYFQLVETSERNAHYKLLIRSGPKSKEIKKELPVFCIEKMI